MGHICRYIQATAIKKAEAMCQCDNMPMCQFDNVPIVEGLKRFLNTNTSLHLSLPAYSEAETKSTLYILPPPPQILKLISELKTQNSKLRTRN